MSDRCPNDEELFALAERPPTDPALRHVTVCPRCRNRLRLYHEFLAGEPTASAADSAAARERLGGLIADLARGPRAVARPESGVLDRIRALWNAPTLRLALAAAGLLVVASGALLTWQIRREGPGTLRAVGDPGGYGWDGSSAEEIIVRSKQGKGGGLELQWAAVKGAESYQIRLLAPDLTELRTLAPTAETHVLIPADSLPAPPDPDGLLAYRVVALHGGAPVASSRVGTFQRR